MTINSEKPKLNYLDLIQHCKDKGITFNLIEEKEAIRYLENRNYYFKLTAYRSNFKKIDGIYQNLDFAYLIDLANIDATLRRFIIDTSLNLEHALKVWILNYITKDADKDGYAIVDDFSNSYPNAYDQIIQYMTNSSYSSDLNNKHSAHISIWVLVEFMSFGPLSQFIDFYSYRKNTRAIRNVSKTMKYAKNMRNASAHSNALLLNLFTDKEFILRPDAVVVTEGTKMGIDYNYLQDMKIHDLIALFTLAKRVLSNESLKHVANQGRHVSNRFNKNENYYDEVPTIKQFKQLFTKMIDYIDPT
ncbi:Abi family protein [Weissella minor]|uniref:Abi family protein n=1 Tax=Weissella minor TaxID=1620 RepID=UPI001BAF8256|nr:Abi family protein [Weissella minor]MBS0950550.1 Abi family protein [Weissella minor]